jgi:hypothetical protein
MAHKRARATSDRKESLSRATRAYLAEMGARGGRRSKRVLTTEQSRAMVRVREARRAFKRFKALCFWSYDPEMKITSDDVAWVVEMLRRHGNRQAWEVADSLCP